MSPFIFRAFSCVRAAPCFASVTAHVPSSARPSRRGHTLIDVRTQDISGVCGGSDSGRTKLGRPPPAPFRPGNRSRLCCRGQPSAAVRARATGSVVAGSRSPAALQPAVSLSAGRAALSGAARVSLTLPVIALCGLRSAAARLRPPLGPPPDGDFGRISAVAGTGINHGA